VLKDKIRERHYVQIFVSLFGSIRIKEVVYWYKITVTKEYVTIQKTIS
jgi:hypothetical protein